LQTFKARGQLDDGTMQKSNTIGRTVCRKVNIMKVNKKCKIYEKLQKYYKPHFRNDCLHPSLDDELSFKCSPVTCIYQRRRDFLLGMGTRNSHSKYYHDSIGSNNMLLYDYGGPRRVNAIKVNALQQSNTMIENKIRKIKLQGGKH
jgi:hypothetical protein